MLVDHQAAPPPKITVTARDPRELADLLRGRSYMSVAADVGVSKAYIGDLATGKRDRVSMGVAAGIEQALGLDRGALFHVDPASRDAAAPYLR